jgi:hypothetical protein
LLLTQQTAAITTVYTAAAVAATEADSSVMQLLMQPLLL